VDGYVLEARDAVSAATVGVSRSSDVDGGIPSLAVAAAGIDLAFFLVVSESYGKGFVA